MTLVTRASLVATTFAVVLGLGAVHGQANGYDFVASFRFGWSLAFATLLGVAAYALGLPDVVPLRRAPLAAVGSVVAGTVGISLLQLAFGTPLLPRFVLFGAALVVAPLQVFWVAVASRGRSEAAIRDRVLFVDSSADPDEIVAELAADRERPAVLVGAVSEQEVEPTPENPLPLTVLVEERRANVLVLSRAAQENDLVVHEAAVLHERGLRVRTVALFYEEWLGKLPIAELERASLMFDIGELHRSLYARMSRVMDVALAIVGMAAFLAITPMVAVLNLVANRGPLFYTQPRVGKGGEVFTIFKFRTMRPMPTGRLVNEWTAVDDPRVTPVGRLLRLTHLDELPQVINILRGDLSVVGPRPEQPHYVAKLVEKLPFYSLRHLVRPGLTGWAQVKYGYAGSEQDALQKLQYEFFYLRHQSITLDARIVARTVRTIVGRGGR